MAGVTLGSVTSYISAEWQATVGVQKNENGLLEGGHSRIHIMTNLKESYFFTTLSEDTGGEITFFAFH